jgi:hypothetical protein
MNIKAKILLKTASAFLVAVAITLAPLAKVNAATNIWTGTTDLSFSTATNWSTGTAATDGDTVVFDSTNSPTVYPATASLTNASGSSFAGLTATGTKNNYNYTIDKFKAAGGSTLATDNATTNKVTVTTLTAQGDVTLDGISATTINVLNGGNVTLKNLTTLPTTITGAGNIILTNDGTMTQTQIAAYAQAAGKSITISGTTNATNLTLTDNTFGTNRNIVVSSASILTLTVAGTDYTTPITMNGGELRLSATGSATVATLSVIDNSNYYIPANSHIYATSYALSTGKTFTQAFGSTGTFSGTAASGTGATTTPAPGTGATTTPATTTTTTPGTPNTAVNMILTNPLTIILTTVALAGATVGIIRLQRNRQ